MTAIASPTKQVTPNNTSTTLAATDVLTRAYSMQIPKWQRFQTTLMIPSCTGATKKIDEHEAPHSYSRQYSQVYYQRLSSLRPKCWDAIQNDLKFHMIVKTKDDAVAVKASSSCNHNDKNDEILRVERILELRENIPSAVVGTIVKVMSDEGGGKSSLVHPKSVCYDTDQLFLEDESGRVAIELLTSSQYNKHQFCSGIVLGVVGTVGVDGVLSVEHIFYPHNRIPKELSQPSSKTTTQSTQPDPHLLLLSGLYCGSNDHSSLTRDMVVSFLQGALQGSEQKAALISHVIVAGGLIASPPTTTTMKHGYGPEYDHSSSTIHGCRELDGFCYQITAGMKIPVTILPGKDDPTTANWPQRPLHKSLLPISVRRSHAAKILSVVPNPYAASYEIKIDGPNENDDMDMSTIQRYVIGTDGGNIQDLTKRLLEPVKPKNATNDNDENPTSNHLTPISELKALACTLQWGHICPSGPETVPTIPHGPENPDPMVISQYPSIYFCGNSTKFATKSVNGCRLICIPKFTETGEVVLVNLRTLQVELLRFEE